MPSRLLIGIVMAIFVYFTPSFQNYDRTFPWYYFALAILIYGVQQVFLYNMFVSQMAFFAQVSDPKIGGTYMTLLNTLSNLGEHRASIYPNRTNLPPPSLSGSSWVSTAVLYSADYLTWKTCSLGDVKCSTPAEQRNCGMLGGACRDYIDAYYIEVAISTLLGVIWLIWKYGTMMRLQSLPITAWQVRGESQSYKPLATEE